MSTEKDNDKVIVVERVFDHPIENIIRKGFLSIFRSHLDVNVTQDPALS